MSSESSAETVSLGITATPPETNGEMPYPGLRHFRESDRRFFFGRKAERETIIASLFSGPLTVYYGASGVGKTSLLLADVIPYLKGLKEKPSGINAKRFSRVAVALFRKWAVPDFQEILRETVIEAIEASPLAPPNFRHLLPAVEEKLYKSLNSHPEEDEDFQEAGFEEAAGNQPDPPSQNPPSKHPPLVFSDFLRACCQLFKGNIFLFFDQFEEYFRYHQPSNDPLHFDRQFAGVLNCTDLPVSVLVSMREEGLATLDRFQFSVPNILRNLMRIRDLDRNASRAAIREPLEEFNRDKYADEKISIEDGFVEALLNEVVPQEIPLKPGEKRPARQTRRYRGAAYLQMLLESAWHQMRESGQRVLSTQTVIDASRKFAEPSDGAGDSGRSRDATMDSASFAQKIVEEYVRQAREAELDDDGGDADQSGDATTDFAGCARRIAEGYVRQLMEVKLDEVWAKMPESERKEFEPVDPKRARDVASRVFPFMVTPGGAKMAQSVDTLHAYAMSAAVGTDCAETWLFRSEVNSTLRLLSKTGLIRLVGPDRLPRQNIYEVAHDVLGVATDKWREEYQRKKAALKAREEAEREQQRKLQEAEREQQRALEEARREQERKLEEEKRDQVRALEDARREQERLLKVERANADQEIATHRAEVEARRAEVEKRRKRGFQIVAGVAVALVIYTSILLVQKTTEQNRLKSAREKLEKLQKETARERDDIQTKRESGLRSGQYIRAAETAMQLVGNRERPPTYLTPRQVAMSSIPRGSDREKMLASPRALLALRFVTCNTIEQVNLWDENAIQEAFNDFERYLPFAQSPDSKLVITIESVEVNQATPVVWDTVKLYEHKHDLGSLKGEDAHLVAMTFSEDSKRFFVKSANGNVWTWPIDTQSATPQLVPKDEANKIFAEKYKYTKKLPEKPDRKNPWFFSYTAVRDRWILDSLVDLAYAPSSTFQIEDRDLKRKLPPGLEPFDSNTIKKIQDAFKIAETDIAKAEAELIDALKDIIVVKPKGAGESLALGLMRQGNKFASIDEKDKAIDLYKSAMALREDLETLNPEAEAERWAKLGKFNYHFEEGRQYSEDGKSDLAKASFKEAKKVDPEQWALAFEVSMKAAAELPTDGGGAPALSGTKPNTADDESALDRLIAAIRRTSVRFPPSASEPASPNPPAPPVPVPPQN
jgi:hypothetical protein